MTLIFLTSLITVLTSLFAAILLGGYTPIAIMLGSLVVMWAVVKYDDYKKQKANKKNKFIGYGEKVWGM